MSTNPLSSYGPATTGEWIYINMTNASGGEYELPSDWANTESIFEIFIRSRNNAANLPYQYVVYNPAAAGTTAKDMYPAWTDTVTKLTAASNKPLLNIAAKTTTVFNVFFVKNATSGKLLLAQNTNATASNREACDIWIRRIAAVTSVP